MIQVYLGLTGALFVIFGLMGLVQPIPMLAGFGYEVSGPHALIESRAMYGGVFITAGLLMLVALFREALAAPALWFAVVYLGGLVAGRLVSVAVDGAPAGYFWGFIALEIVLIVPAAVALRSMHQNN